MASDMKTCIKTVSQSNVNKRFQEIYDYIEQYQKELELISGELGRSKEADFSGPPLRKNWIIYREEQTLNNRFYQGEYVYFNPDQKSRTDKNVDYYAVNRVIRMLGECGYTQQNIAAVCNVSTAIVSGWMTGKEHSNYINGQEVRDVHVKEGIRNNFEFHPNIHPDKYQWWAIAIEICLPATLLDPFLMMVGAVFEPFRMEDQIIYSQMRADTKTTYRPEKNSAANVHQMLKGETRLDRKLCQDALYAFHVIKREKQGKTRSKKDKTQG